MKRYLDDRVQADLVQKMVFLTGPRQVGKTTLSRHLIAQHGGQYLDYGVPADRALILNQRWNPQAPLLVTVFDGLVRNDVLEFSRIQEVNAIRLFAQMLCTRVGSPLSLASMARDLAVSPNTLKKYFDILEALYIVFVVRPWHDNIARSVLQSPKVYFYDTGLVEGDEGLRFENLVARALPKHVQWQHDVQGKEAGLHCIRTKDRAEVDFALSEKSLCEDRAHGGLWWAGW